MLELKEKLMYKYTHYINIYTYFINMHMLRSYQFWLHAPHSTQLALIGQKRKEISLLKRSRG